MKIKEDTQGLIKEENLLTILLVLAGIFCIGNTGKIIGGIALLDIVLGALFFYSVLRFNRFRIEPLFWLSFVIYGVGVSVLHLLLKSGPGYDYIVTETRYFIYFFVIAQVVGFTKINVNTIERILPVLILSYIIVYLLLFEGSFVYSIFNKVGDELDKFDFEGRTSGPQTVFISSLIYLIRVVNKKINKKILFLYFVLVGLAYIRTGSRTQLLVNFLPIIWILLIEKRFVLLSVSIGIGALTVPFFLNAIQLNRFANIVNPLGDSAFMFRLFNIQIMISRLWNEFIPLFFGYGIGSNYDAYIVVDWFESYFLDNTIVTMVYKIGLPLTILFWLGVFHMSRYLNKIDRYFFIIYIGLPTLISYHFISNPVYFLAYSIGVRVLSDNHEWKLSNG